MDTTCLNCFDTLVSDDILKLSKCKHSYHKCCLHKWKNYVIENNLKYRCPYCRKKIKLQIY